MLIFRRIHCIHAAYGTVTLYESSWWRVGTQHQLCTDCIRRGNLLHHSSLRFVAKILLLCNKQSSLPTSTVAPCHKNFKISNLEILKKFSNFFWAHFGPRALAPFSLPILWLGSSSSYPVPLFTRVKTELPLWLDQTSAIVSPIYSASSNKYHRLNETDSTICCMYTIVSSWRWALEARNM